MLSRVPKTSRYALRTDKVRATLACKSYSGSPDVASRTSPLNDVLLQPADKAKENGYLFN